MHLKGFPILNTLLEYDFTNFGGFFDEVWLLFGSKGQKYEGKKGKAI